jgi:hypothetical protein
MLLCIYNKLVLVRGVPDGSSYIAHEALFRLFYGNKALSSTIFSLIKL